MRCCLASACVCRGDVCVVCVRFERCELVTENDVPGSAPATRPIVGPTRQRHHGRQRPPASQRRRRAGDARPPGVPSPITQLGLFRFTPGWSDWKARRRRWPQCARGPLSLASVGGVRSGWRRPGLPLPRVTSSGSSFVCAPAAPSSCCSCSSSSQRRRSRQRRETTRVNHTCTDVKSWGETQRRERNQERSKML